MTKEGFQAAFAANLGACTWEPDPEYSVFTQYDAELYTRVKEHFVHKYKVFWSVARTLMPTVIIELGCFAGSSADAYVSASRASYIGYDLFEFADPMGLGQQSEPAKFDPFRVAVKLLGKRGFLSWELRRRNLRHMTTIPDNCDLGVVDAAHDYTNAIADLKLIATANPKWVWVDDYAGKDVQRACAEFCEDRNPAWTCEVPYINQGYLISFAP